MALTPTRKPRPPAAFLHFRAQVPTPGPCSAKRLRAAAPPQRSQTRAGGDTSAPRHQPTAPRGTRAAQHRAPVPPQQATSHEGGMRPVRPSGPDANAALPSLNVQRAQAPSRCSLAPTATPCQTWGEKTETAYQRGQSLQRRPSDSPDQARARPATAAARCLTRGGSAALQCRLMESYAVKDRRPG
jgi:hypothetical protein